MDTLRKQLKTACDYGMSDETIDSLFELMTAVRLKNKQPLIPYGKFDDNIYIVNTGIIRYAYFDGLKENTFAFASSGDLILNHHSFYGRVPSFFQYESCGESVVMKVSKARFDELLSHSTDLKNWMLRMTLGQLWSFDRKVEVMNGTAKERFEAFVRNRPEILKNVSTKIIASYIGVTSSSLCRLKREMKK
jgi:CRP-like cAMP-binding protein